MFRVRKATALKLHKICKVVGDAGIQRLLPAYVRLTKDDVYRVSDGERGFPLRRGTAEGRGGA